MALFKLRKLYKNLSAHLRLGLFGRILLFLAVLILLSLSLCLQALFSMAPGPYGTQTVQHIISSVNLARTTLAHAEGPEHNRRLVELASNGKIELYPRKAQDITTPLPHEQYWQHLARQMQQHGLPGTQAFWSVNQVPGLWISFQVDNDAYWLRFEREHISLMDRQKWLSLGITELLITLIGAVIGMLLVNRHLDRLSEAAQHLARGETPVPLEEQRGPLEICAVNASFNQMAQKIRQTDADRALMLAGLSHDLRTQLARMRLEIELSAASDSTRLAIDEDMEQINHGLEQLMDYARPVPPLAKGPTEVSALLVQLCERERKHPAFTAGALTVSLEPGLLAKIDSENLKRIISNLVENARRYGKSEDGLAYLSVTLHATDTSILIEVADRGPGIPPQNIMRLLQPFSRGTSDPTHTTGVGLGLTIVQRLLQHVGGTFNLHPREGGGLRAQITLPRVKL